MSSVAVNVNREGRSSRIDDCPKQCPSSSWSISTPSASRTSTAPERMTCIREFGEPAVSIWVPLRTYEAVARLA